MLPPQFLFRGFPVIILSFQLILANVLLLRPFLVSSTGSCYCLWSGWAESAVRWSVAVHQFCVLFGFHMFREFCLHISLILRVLSTARDSFWVPHVLCILFAHFSDSASLICCMSSGSCSHAFPAFGFTRSGLCLLFPCIPASGCVHSCLLSDNSHFTRSGLLCAFWFHMIGTVVCVQIRYVDLLLGINYGSEISDLCYCLVLRLPVYCSTAIVDRGELL